MQNTEVIEHFFGVYLLYCLNPRYLGRNYIGFTVDPNRRIKQHNKGKKFGGAWKTSERGPWKMVLIVHGFPNEIAALRFEWAWQHPQQSRRLRHISRKKSKEKMFDFNLRLLSEMLHIGPWNRLPLTIRWLEEEFAKDFPAQKTPPMHMPICYGPVISKKLQKPDKLSQRDQNVCDELQEVFNYCFICKDLILKGNELKCLAADCNLISHIICLSKLFLTEGEYVPIEGSCPKCNKTFLWGEVIRKFKGCYENNTASASNYSSDSDPNQESEDD